MAPSHPILIGECIDMMWTMPDQSVQCCLTRPPYFELRDDSVDAQIGQEETLPSSNGNMKAVARKPNGVGWGHGTYSQDSARGRIKAVVAIQEGRKSILCERNPDYAAMAEQRIAAAWLDGAAQMDVIHDSAPAA